MWFCVIGFTLHNNVIVCSYVALVSAVACFVCFCSVTCRVPHDRDANRSSMSSASAACASCHFSLSEHSNIRRSSVVGTAHSTLHDKLLSLRYRMCLWHFNAWHSYLAVVFFNISLLHSPIVIHSHTTHSSSPYSMLNFLSPRFFRIAVFSYPPSRGRLGFSDPPRMAQGH